MGRSSRRKGCEEEKKVAIELRALGIDAVTSRSADRRRDVQGVDIYAPGLAVQVKRGASPRIRAALKEAVSGADADELPAAVVTHLDLRRPRRLLVLDWDDDRVRTLLRIGLGIQAAEVLAILDEEMPDA